MDQTTQDLITTLNAEISVPGFVINLILAAVLAFLLHSLYIRHGNSLSNRRMFARNFMMITLTTMLIITVIKSSLALSLGLVGALSVVRFRAAIKEPEELAYLFLAIAIGLGLGANQRVITIIAFGFIAGMIWLKSLSQQSEENQNLYLTVTSHNPAKAELKAIVQVLNKHCTQVDLKRFDETEEMLEAAFLVEFENFEHLEAAKSSLRKLGDSIKLTFLDNKALASTG